MSGRPRAIETYCRHETNPIALARVSDVEHFLKFAKWKIAALRKIACQDCNKKPSRKCHEMLSRIPNSSPCRPPSPNPTITYMILEGYFHQKVCPFADYSGLVLDDLALFCAKIKPPYVSLHVFSNHLNTFSSLLPSFALQMLAHAFVIRLRLLVLRGLYVFTSIPFWLTSFANAGPVLAYALSNYIDQAGCSWESWYPIQASSHFARPCDSLATQRRDCWSLCPGKGGWRCKQCSRCRQ